MWLNWLQYCWNYLSVYLKLKFTEHLESSWLSRHQKLSVIQETYFLKLFQRRVGDNCHSVSGIFFSRFERLAVWSSGFLSCSSVVLPVVLCVKSKRILLFIERKFLFSCWSVFMLENLKRCHSYCVATTIASDMVLYKYRGRGWEFS